MNSNVLILALDVGTTTVRILLMNKLGNVIYSSRRQILCLYPKPGYVEIHPETVWNAVFEVISDAILWCHHNDKIIQSLGISCQRCTFITWNKETQKPYHNFITWKDIRANSLVNQMNNSFKVKLLRLASKCLYTVTRNKRLLAGSVFKFMNAQVIPRLLWVLKYIPNLAEETERGQVLFGTMDTWLLYKLSEGKLHITDVSCASATGLFDPFTMSWADWAIKLFNIPKSILPNVVESAGKHFGNTSEEIIGSSIPIRCMIADQAAALFGSCCFKEGELKITMGTGTFLNVNTGEVPHTSITGIYPVIGWKVNGETVYIAEGSSSDTGTLIQWALEMGLINDPSESSDLADSIQSTNGVYFVPAFSGIQAPINDHQAGSGFIGIKPTSRKEHLLRAILEAIVFRVTQIFQAFTEELLLVTPHIKVDGGVAKNDFVVQMLADIIGVPIIRSSNVEMSALGAGYLAGYFSGIWEKMEDFRDLNNNWSEFIPKPENKEMYKKTFSLWNDAIDRFRGWYKEE